MVGDRSPQVDHGRVDHEHERGVAEHHRTPRKGIWSHFYLPEQTLYTLEQLGPHYPCDMLNESFLFRVAGIEILGRYVDCRLVSPGVSARQGSLKAQHCFWRHHC